MKKLLILMLLSFGLSALLSGCGTVDSASDRWRRVQDINELYSRQAVDDIDMMFLYDKNLRLSPYHARIGR